MWLTKELKRVDHVQFRSDSVTTQGDDTFLNKILFSDELHFHLNKIVKFGEKKTHMPSTNL